MIMIDINSKNHIASCPKVLPVQRQRDRVGCAELCFVFTGLRAVYAVGCEPEPVSVGRACVPLVTCGGVGHAPATKKKRVPQCCSTWLDSVGPQTLKFQSMSVFVFRFRKM